MAHKKKNSEPELQPDETKEETAVQSDVQPEDKSGAEIPDTANPEQATQVIPPTIAPPTVVLPVPPVIPAAPAQKTAVVPVVPKKRIRIRPSQKKKLSVAVLCTNPITRRFI